MTPCIVFEVEGTAYALRALTVQMVDMVENVTRVPRAPAWVDGVASVRGKVVPVVNLRRRFGFEPRPYDLESRLLVVSLEGRLVGLLADRSREFLSLDLEAMEPAPAAIRSGGNEALEGVVTHAGRLIMLLSPERLLTPAEMSSVK